MRRVAPDNTGSRSGYTSASGGLCRFEVMIRLLSMSKSDRSGTCFLGNLIGAKSVSSQAHGTNGSHNNLVPIGRARSRFNVAAFSTMPQSQFSLNRDGAQLDLTDRAAVQL